jgi:signal transduction histidine kinase
MAYSNLKRPTPKKILCKNIINEIITLLKVDSDEKKITIDLDLKTEQIWADEESLRQILFNLLHNAIKAVDESGEISITSGTLNKRKVWIQIADNGSGIPENAMNDIFKPYFTLDPSGTGLGLAIVKQLAFNHGWKIKYLKNTPKGAIFRIEGIDKESKSST